MRNFLFAVALLCLGALGWAQTSSQGAAATKPPVHHLATGEPTAIIQTSPWEI